MGIVMLVACGIDAIAYVILSLGSFFGLITGHVALSLLGYYFIDIPFLRLEIIADMGRFIRSGSILENGCPLPGAGSVLYSVSIDQATVNLHPDYCGSEFYLLVIDFAVTEQRGISSSGPDHRIIGFVCDRIIKCVPLRRPGLNSVGSGLHNGITKEFPNIRKGIIEGVLPKGVSRKKKGFRG